MKPLIDYFREKVDDTHTLDCEADADLYEAILELNEKLTNTMSALVDLYELLLEQNGEEE